jgi:hypothetical protein
MYRKGLIVRFTAHHAYFGFSVLILKFIVKSNHRGGYCNYWYCLNLFFLTDTCINYSFIIKLFNFIIKSTKNLLVSIPMQYSQNYSLTLIIIVSENN